MRTIFLHSFRSVTFTGAIASVLLAASPAKAQSGSENTSFFGTYGQGNSAIVDVSGQSVANMACVPTAVVNGLTYLQNYQTSVGGTGPLATAPGYSDINELINSSFMGTTANGTGMGNAANGLTSYTSSTGPNPATGMTISGQYTGVSIGGTNYTSGWFNGMPGTLANTTPTASFLANALNANDGVEFTLWWGPNAGGHELTLQSINMTAGTISFYDPWGDSQISATATNAGSSATLIDASVELLGNGFLLVTYPDNNAMTGVEPDPEEEGSTDPGDANGQAGLIIADMTEAVPEPTPFALTGAAIVTCAGWRFLRRRLTRNRS